MSSIKMGNNEIVKMISIDASMSYNECFFCLITILAATPSDLWSKANE